MKSFFTLSLLIGLIIPGFNNVETISISNLEGIWVQEGYGRVIEIAEEQIKVFDVSKVSCVPIMELPIEYLKFIGDISKITDQHMTISGGINHMDFERVDQMPDVCLGYSDQDMEDPIHNFESLWHTFNEQYCAFEKRGVDWDEMYNKYRPKVTSKTSDIDLLLIIENMMDELKDGHVGIETPERLEKAYDRKKAASSSNKTLDPTNSELKVTARKSILEQYVGDYKEYNKGVLRWGMMDNGFAYLQINAMERWADFGISDNLDNSAFWNEYFQKEGDLREAMTQNVNGASKIINEVLEEKNDAQAYILDVRFNGGGFDEVALAIMNHFALEKIPVFTKKGRNGNSYTRTLTAHVEPASKTFKGPVYVLTSVETASAAEIMTMAARAMPNVELIGTATEGIFSDILEKQLPIGWTYGLSNEIYESIDGKDFESLGVPPDHEIGYRRWTRGFLEDITEDLKDGDDAIAKAFELFDNR